MIAFNRKHNTKYRTWQIAGFLIALLIGFIASMPAWAAYWPAGDEMNTEFINGRQTTTIDQSGMLETDKHIDGDLVIKADINLNGRQLSVTGNVLMDANVNLAGGRIYIAGDLHQVNGTMYINAGLLQVAGNYYIEGTEKDDSGIPKSSYGTITMDNTADKIWIGKDFWARSSYTSKLTAGEMQFKGNVTDYTGNTIRATGTHRANFMNTQLVTVDLQNGAAFESIITGSVSVQFKQLGINKLTYGITLFGDVENIYTKLNLNGYTMTIRGTVQNVTADMDLNCGTLVVNGDFYQGDTCIYFNGGTLQVDGNYYLQSREKEEDGKTPQASYGLLSMDNKNDKLIVGKNFFAKSKYSSVLTAGTMEFKGNVTDYTGNTIRGSKEHLAVFSGRNNQVVDLQNSSACFQSIRTINQSVTFKQLGINKLTENIFLVGNIEDIWNTLDLNGYQIQLNGSVKKVSADIYLNSGIFKVSGSFTQVDPTIYFMGGTLEVGGDYLIESTGKNDDGTPANSYGRLMMENVKDKLIVGGNFSAKSSYSSVLSAGVMDFKGNVTDYTGNTFRCSGSHKVEFSGYPKRQVVDLQNRSACFETIGTYNDYVTMKQFGVHKLTESIHLDGDVENIWHDLDLNGKWLVVNGNIKNVSADINLNGGQFFANKDLCLTDGTIYFNGGTLWVDGSFTIESTEKNDDGTQKNCYGRLFMENDKDRLVVSKNFLTRSSYSSVLSAGQMEFAGNVTDYTGNTVRCYGTNKAVFNGKGTQTVEFANTNSCFQSIRTSNQNVHFKTFAVNQLTENVIIAGSVEKIWKDLDLNGKRLVIKGDLGALMADVDLNRGKLSVNGNFRQLDADIYFHKGTLQIGGDYLLQSAEKNEDGSYKTVWGRLYMEDPADHMVVSGNFIASSQYSSVMTAGTIEVAGQVEDTTGHTLKMSGKENETALITSTKTASNETETATTSSQDKDKNRHRNQTEQNAYSDEDIATVTVTTSESQEPKKPTQETTVSVTESTTDETVDTPPKEPTVPADTAKYMVKETSDKVFYLYMTEDDNWDHSVKVPVNTWLITDFAEVSFTSLALTGDGGCKLTVQTAPSTNPFTQGPNVTVTCTYNGKSYSGVWYQGIVLADEEETPTITPEQQSEIDLVVAATPTTMPPGLIRLGKIEFKAYNDSNLPITGYEYAVKEGDDGEWKTVLSTKDEVSMSTLFPSLELGKTYWYRYRYYITVNGVNHYSYWSETAGDVYTIYDNTNL
ncbi:MAG: hypothetical protein IKE43_11105 [Coriobacteriales bacterium]|nr:hypothetical protein [Coriobacteriales bacterium]